MKRKMLLAGLMVSAMGFSSLFAVEDEDVKSEQCRSYGCNNFEEEVKTPLISDDEDTTLRLTSGDKGDALTSEDEIKKLLVG